MYSTDHTSLAQHAFPGSLADRLAAQDPTRLGETMAALVQSLTRLLEDLRPTPCEYHAVIAFLTEVGHHSDVQRQEWVLLADALGLSARMEDATHQRPFGATPDCGPGPFYRPDAPAMSNGASISRDGRGVPLQVTGRVRSLGGTPVPAASVETWQANGDGLYENQQPDRQPEHNLRGRFACDAQGRFTYRSVMPRGYALPTDGPVGRLLCALNLPAMRPAHVHFRVSAPGFETLTTQIFDRADPAIGRDPVFGVRPGLLAEFRTIPPEERHGAGGRSLDLDLVLCPERQKRKTNGGEK